MSSESSTTNSLSSHHSRDVMSIVLDKDDIKKIWYTYEIPKEVVLEVSIYEEKLGSHI